MSRIQHPLQPSILRRPSSARSYPQDSHSKPGTLMRRAWTSSSATELTSTPEGEPFTVSDTAGNHRFRPPPGHHRGGGGSDPDRPPVSTTQLGRPTRLYAVHTEDDICTYRVANTSDECVEEKQHVRRQVLSKIPVYALRISVGISACDKFPCC